MPFGNLAARPDLRPLFGPMDEATHDALLNRLLAVDARLEQLAESASAHVGVPYRLSRLSLVNLDDGSSAGIHGGPSGDAGDLWFDISPVRAAEPVAVPTGARWVVESVIWVFCSDSPEPRGSSSTHALERLEDFASTPAQVLDLLEAHVSQLTAAMYGHAASVFTSTPHAQLP